MEDFAYFGGWPILIHSLPLTNTGDISDRDLPAPDRAAERDGPPRGGHDHHVRPGREDPSRHREVLSEGGEGTGGGTGRGVGEVFVVKGVCGCSWLQNLSQF